MSAETDTLKRLQDWYASQCDGGWEHTYGISITTLDNPGWFLKVALTDTYLFDRAFDAVSVQGAEEDDWYVCKVANRVFEGACGPRRLNDIIRLFLDWANR